MPIDAGEIVKSALEIAKPIGGSLSDAWQAVVGDKVAAWRLKNAANLQLKVRQELERQGLALNLAKIPERYAFSWFEEATKQDEPEIQELFARLLARAAKGDEDAGDRRHLEIVTRLVPIDARVMRHFFEKMKPIEPIAMDGEDIAEIEVEEWTLYKSVSEEFSKDAWKSVEHLTALGVLERRVTVDSDSIFNALSNLSFDQASQSVSPIWGAQHALEIKPLIASTAIGMALHRAISA